MIKLKKLLLILPYLLLAGIMVNTWVLFLRDTYYTERLHWAALILVIVNGLLYLRWMKQAVLFTGIMLALATINLLFLFPDITRVSLGFNPGNGAVYTPGIEPKALLLLVVYGVINGRYLFNLYLDRKEARAKLKRK